MVSAATNLKTAGQAGGGRGEDVKIFIGRDQNEQD